MKTMVSRSRRFVRVRCFLCGNAPNDVSEDETFFRALCVCVYVRVLVCVVDWGTGQAVLTLLDGSELGIGVVIGGAAAVVGMG